ncbi:VOC family protein [Siccirubricoccus sp. KC 17139]|uniref:VOC family protein n=1 Tax=Siccirubricoccus soli TaxID=2899147 RepID=A0ABT1D1R5_9PROT|nr:VOC family protein [Siccirubricoccus soli]MCO6415562.1 VOC family protein [Siccirubricoccus soli]MCP2681694.1 VOC family protein [Siccirubricoccus soli]
MAKLQRITPSLWFDGNKAEEAVAFYLSVFPGAKPGQVMRASAAGPGPEGGVLALTFKIEGTEVIALNGRPEFGFTPAVSLMLLCRDQAEVDLVWDRLLAGGKPMQCGWLTDRFGVTWQVVPDGVRELLWEGDPAGRARAMQAMAGMVKLDLAAMRAAYAGGSTP